MMNYNLPKPPLNPQQVEACKSESVKSPPALTPQQQLELEQLDLQLQQATASGIESELESAISDAKAWCLKYNCSWKQLTAMKQAKRKLKSLSPTSDEGKGESEVKGKGSMPTAATPPADTTSSAEERRERRLQEVLREMQVEEAEQSQSITADQLGEPTRVGDLIYYTSKAATLGEGSDGTIVCIGEHLQWGRLAVKVVDNARVPQRRSEREQALLLRLADECGVGSDNVIKYRCKANLGSHFILGMELCECSLHQLITDLHATPTVQQQQRVVKELCQGVSFLHRHGIIHRDIRPKVVTHYKSSSKIL